jgi:predicted Zn-dependent peptidase
MCASDLPSAFELEGVRVLYQRVPGHPLVAFRLQFDVQEEPGPVQLWAETLALSVLAIAGSERDDPSSWSTQLTELGAELSSSGGTDYRSLRVSVLRTNWSAAWNLLVDAIENPNTDHYYLENRRGVAAYSYDSEHEQAATAARTEAFSRLFRGSVANRAREGLSALQKIVPSELKEAWRGLWTKQRLLITVVGDVSEHDVREVVARRLRKLSERHAPGFAERPLRLGSEEAVAVLAHPESPTWDIRADFMGPRADAPDYGALELGLQVLDGRLFDQVCDLEGLAYTTGAGISFYRQSYGSIWLSTDAPELALPLVTEITRALKQAGPDGAELERARQVLREQQLQSLATPEGIATELTDWQLTVDDVAYGEHSLAAREEFTPEDVAAALRAYLVGAVVVAAGSGSALSESDLASVFD